MGKTERGVLQNGVANFGDPRAPVPLADAAVSLLWPSHGGRVFVMRNVMKVFVIISI